ncbi:flagellar biosynthesis (GTP-binding) protein [Campylobacter avium LMG 24591]|uniref:Flagellar biosynthesis protein FlhF n=1 Tax=Campylobacter avium LMG 24591 TaxID=522484 RepID=A0A222MVI7_9BACT|nr:flagellar biosynthesis protein FlhF [Campylobacter avium]ASQ29919.1 flagellar biosynthesis (GTP-binding) protein [Campylobacter avium LMG 24591]OYD79018.1 flagellar biosynthesis (GTP-binding) protein [Campylobacter avium]
MGQLIHTFTVEDTDEIIPRVKQDYGDEAMIVTHKQIKAKTLTQKPLYEVVVAVEEKDYEEHLQKTGKTPPAKKIVPEVKKEDDVILDFSKAAQDVKKKAYENINQSPKTKLDNFKKRLSEVSSEINKVANLDEISTNSINYEKKIQSFEKQINKLSEKVSLIVDMMWQDKTELKNNIIIPPEFASIYKQAKESGMKEEHLEAIMKATVENMPASMKTNAEAVSRYFYSLLRNMLPCRAETEIKKQKIMMLVGPTGVGKTTTLAKLAFRYAYGDKRYKTGIITLDTYRIGAVEQLFQYAKMMKLPIIDSIEPKDLDEAIKSLNYCEVILVDTIGNSQYDQSKLAKTKEFLSHSNSDIDVNLVISANTKFEDLKEIYDNFSSYLDIDTLIITKFDETKVFGNIFSLIYETNVPISFFSVGQEVPDDIELATSDFLVKCVLEGFKRKE